MELALECPPQFMSDLLPLTDFDFALAHLCLPLNNPSPYTNYYRDRPPGRRLVLDNGTNELGNPVSLEEMDKVAKVLNPEVIIPPDYLGNGRRTLRSLEKAEFLWGRERILPVIQGANLPEVWNSVDFLVDVRGYETLALPYDICLDRTYPLPILASMRNQVVTYIFLHHPTCKIHLLGFNTLREVQSYFRYFPQVVSLDTGAPFLNASVGKIFSRDPLVPKGTYIDYSKDYEGLVPHISEVAKVNIKVLKSAMNGGIPSVGDQDPSRANRWG